MSNQKRCPFCGSPDAIMVPVEDRVTCPVCRATAPTATWKQRHVNMWAAVIVLGMLLATGIIFLALNP